MLLSLLLAEAWKGPSDCNPPRNALLQVALYLARKDSLCFIHHTWQQCTPNICADRQLLPNSCSRTALGKDKSFLPYAHYIFGCRLKIGRGPLLGRALEFLSDQGSQAVRGQRALLEAWTSVIEMDVLASGALVNRRMDLLVGSFSRGAPAVPECVLNCGLR